MSRLDDALDRGYVPHPDDNLPPAAHLRIEGDPLTQLAADVEQNRRTPKPWPADAWPTPAELADWLSRCTSAERVEWAAAAIGHAQRSTRCQQLHWGMDGRTP